MSPEHRRRRQRCDKHRCAEQGRAVLEVHDELLYSGKTGTGAAAGQRKELTAVVRGIMNRRPSSPRLRWAGADDAGNASGRFLFRAI